METESRSREKGKEANLMLDYCCYAAEHWFGIRCAHVTSLDLATLAMVVPGLVLQESEAPLATKTKSEMANQHFCVRCNGNIKCTLGACWASPPHEWLGKWICHRDCRCSEISLHVYLKVAGVGKQHLVQCRYTHRSRRLMSVGEKESLASLGKKGWGIISQTNCEGSSVACDSAMIARYDSVVVFKTSTIHQHGCICDLGLQQT